MIGEDVLYLTVAELGERIRTRRLSPVELTEGYLERIRRVAPRLNAFATVTPEVALALGPGLPPGSVAMDGATNGTSPGCDGGAAGVAL